MIVIKKTLFMWEGVSSYLKPDSVHAILVFVITSSHNENIIAFDYAISIQEENINNYYGANEFTELWKKRCSSEPFKFAIGEGKTE